MTSRKFKVKLASGRILGPLDLERVRLLILKNQIVGTETARVHPDGEWKNINYIPEIAELLLAKIEGRLESRDADFVDELNPIGGENTVDLAASTLMLPEEESKATERLTSELDATEPETAGMPDHTVALRESEREFPKDLQPPPPPTPTQQVRLDSDVPPKLEMEGEANGSDLEDGDKTMVGQLEEAVSPLGLEGDEEKTRIGSIEQELPVSLEGDHSEEEVPADFGNALSHEKTVFFQRSAPQQSSEEAGKSAKKPLDRKWLIRAIALGALAYVAIDEYLLPPPAPPKVARPQVIRPELPSYNEAQSDPAGSKKVYGEALKYYLRDNVAGYKVAAGQFKKAAGADISNVQALAMLASSYLNLIDSSNKDEKYFSVISKLIEMSRAKKVDLPETVIADVEFYTTVNRAEAAQNRVVEYTKTHPNFGFEMYYYLGLAFLKRGDAPSAARYVGQIPDNKAFSPKVFYLRGQISESLGAIPDAIQEYQKAIAMDERHSKSRLAIARIHARAGKLGEVAQHLEYIVNRPKLLDPPDLAQAYYLHGRLNQLRNKAPEAMADIEKAVRLDEDNHDYLLELYTLRAKAGESDPKFKKNARMYYFLSEGERQVKDGKYDDGLATFLQAREANLEAALPLVKIGDMFVNLNDLTNAHRNYKMAAERAPQNIEVWSKYIQVLIQSYEWKEAFAAMKKFKKIPGAQSSIDKLSGDLYAKQSAHPQAQLYYRRAMARESIDSRVYIAYAKSLMATGNYDDATFYFALALRFDPLNMEAIIGTSKCVAQTDSIQRAIVLLQDELQKLGGARAELIAAMAELRMQAGEWDLAQSSIEAAVSINGRYAYPWKLQAKMYLRNEGIEKDALDKALLALKSYIDRNPSDPDGYLDRYRIFIKQGKLDKANEELGTIFQLYPKYPGLHYYKGSLYSIMGNPKTAIDEFREELKNHPTSVEALIALGKEYIAHDGQNESSVKEAISLFSRAMQVDPSSAEAKQQAGWGNFLMKNYQGSVALFEAAVRLDEGNPLIYKRMGLAYRAMGDASGAARAFRKYLELAPDAPDKAEVQQYL